MTFGEKLRELRKSHTLSKKALADRLGVSRQTVCNWEKDKTTPSLKRLQRLAACFQLEADAFLTKEAPKTKNTPQRCEKFFGTDGFRGEANIELTPERAYRIGRFLGWHYTKEKKKEGARARIVIGKDTRRSSYMLEYALAAGIAASGADAYMLHVTTTPSVSYITKCDEFDCGVMITASHNKFTDNGIKLINRYGEKLEDSTTAMVEEYLARTPAEIEPHTDIPRATGADIGCISDYVAGRNRYMAYLISLAAHSYKKLHIGLDTANGAAFMIASAVFSALGAELTLIGDDPNGININDGCGSTHIEALCRLVREKHLDLGFAFDGDGDRCIAVDERGEVVDGDKILYILASRLKARGMLSKNTVVATVMSNSGLDESLAAIGIASERTAVGDRFVFECMQKKDLALGGEHSGHIILRKYATTGDGLLTAIMLTEELCDSKTTLSKLAAPVKLFPQYTESVRVTDKDAAANAPLVLAKLAEIQQELSRGGRILLRKSGTEPVLRVMVESESEEKSINLAQSLVKVIKEAAK